MASPITAIRMTPTFGVGFTGSIDNVSVRNSPAYGTYENFELDFSDRELMYLQINGDWLGGELVVNGSFATDSDWIKGDWTISGGVANINGNITDSLIYQTLARPPVYAVSLDVSGLAGSSPAVQHYDGLTYADSITSNGKYSFVTVNASSAYSFFTLKATPSTTDATIDNISCKRILQAPT